MLGLRAAFLQFGGCCVRNYNFQTTNAIAGSEIRERGRVRWGHGYVPISNIEAKRQRQVDCEDCTERGKSTAHIASNRLARARDL
jgi:hypothetical protein